MANCIDQKRGILRVFSTELKEAAVLVSITRTSINHASVNGVERQKAVRKRRKRYLIVFVQIQTQGVLIVFGICICIAAEKVPHRHKQVLTGVVLFFDASHSERNLCDIDR